MTLIIGLVIILFVMIMIMLIYNRFGNIENFTPFTSNPVRFIQSECMDSAPRHVRFNKNGGIMYVSNNQPTEGSCNSIKCPNQIDELATLGRDNHCWMC